MHILYQVSALVDMICFILLLWMKAVMPTIVTSFYQLVCIMAQMCMRECFVLVNNIIGILGIILLITLFTVLLRLQTTAFVVN